MKFRIPFFSRKQKKSYTNSFKSISIEEFKKLLGSKEIKFRTHGTTTFIDISPNACICALEGETTLSINDNEEVIMHCKSSKKSRAYNMGTGKITGYDNPAKLKDENLWKTLH